MLLSEFVDPMLIMASLCIDHISVTVHDRIKVTKCRLSLYRVLRKYTPPKTDKLVPIAIRKYSSILKAMGI